MCSFNFETFSIYYVLIKGTYIQAKNMTVPLYKRGVYIIFFETQS